MVNLVTAVGGSQKNAIFNESKSSTNDYKTNLFSFISFRLRLQRNIVVMSFLLAAAGINNIETCKTNKLLSLSASFDCLFAASNACAVTPLFFAINLVAYFICGSRTLISFLSSVTPSGCYKTVLNWFKDKTSCKVQCEPNGDIITYFDNSQILARNWRVRYDAKALISIITSMKALCRNISSIY